MIDGEIALTDTFGGEANFAWVRRGHIPPEVLAKGTRASIRYAKQWAGLSGIRCRKVDTGDEIALYPAGLCQVLFITW